MGACFCTGACMRGQGCAAYPHGRPPNSYWTYDYPPPIPYTDPQPFIDSIDTTISEINSQSVTEILHKKAEGFEKALAAISDALHKQIREGNYPLLDEVWYSLEIGDWVLDGKSYEQALKEFELCEKSPSRWLNNDPSDDGQDLIHHNID